MPRCIGKGTNGECGSLANLPGAGDVKRWFVAFERGDCGVAIAALAPLTGENERIGGSRAQHDLIEFTLLQAYLEAGRLEEARTLRHVWAQQPVGRGGQGGNILRHVAPRRQPERLCRMNRRDWLSRVRAMAARHAKVAPGPPYGRGIQPEFERRLLAEIHRLVSAAPLPVLDTFRNCSEEILAAYVNPQVDSVWEGRFGWAVRSNDPEEWLMAAVGQVRALDQALAEGLSDAGLGPRDPRNWAVPEHAAYVIPRSPHRLDGTSPKQGEPYSRRGLRFHTVLPMRAGGLRVRPIPMSTGPLPDGQMKLGAALFRQAKLNLQAAEDGPAGKRFIAVSFAADDVLSTIDQQVAAAFADGCYAAVWPELTMPPDSQQALSVRLAMSALRHGTECPFRLAVAGSWHERQDHGRHSNVSHILGRTGRRLCSYAKFTAFNDPEWGEESIARGEELPIVIADDLVIGFAICKDFCDRAVASPFAELPVDLMLVPSMGGSSTMAGHLANAEDLRLRTGALVFVVQQSPQAADQGGSKPAALGEVLLSRSKATPMAQHTIWTVHSPIQLPPS